MGTHLHMLAVSLSPPNGQVSAGESGKYCTLKVQHCPFQWCTSGTGGRMADPWAAVSAGRVGGMDGDGEVCLWLVQSLLPGLCACEAVSP